MPLLPALLSLPVLAATPEQIEQLYYLSGTGRGDEARSEAARLLEADPSDPRLHLTWLYLQRSAPPRAKVALEQTYRAWLAQSPGDDARALELALALALLRAGEKDSGGMPRRPGPWCDEVLALMRPEAEDAEIRAMILYRRALVLERCGRDDGAERQALAALAPATQRARLYAVRQALEDDEISEEDAERVAALLEIEPWRASELRLWVESRQGPGLERARGLALEAAGRLASSDQPAMVDAALSVFRSADRLDEAEAALARLKTLDPERAWFPTIRREATEKPEPTPPVLGDPAARLAALGEVEPEDEWEALAWGRDRASLLLELGREEEALDALRRVYVLDPTVSGNLVYGREAARQGRQLWRATRATTIAVEYLEDSDVDPRYGSGRAVEERADLAEALRARSAVLYARGRLERAAEDAERSLLLEESEEAHLLLGLAEELEDADDRRDVFWHLSLALAGDPGWPALRPEAMARLEQLWPEQGLWHPMGLVGWLSTDWSELSSPAEAAREPFPDLDLTVDGQPVKLSSIPGPLVVDLWATWCGPCVQGLPGLDAAARANPELTFLVVSVDRELETATRYFEKVDAGFRPVWGGEAALEATGGGGIPATYVLDAEHRVVESWTGWGPGDQRLEEALRRLEREAAR